MWRVEVVEEVAGGEFAFATGGMIEPGAGEAGEASTAAVKPSQAVTASVVAEYEESCDALLAAVAVAPDLKTAIRFVHPWFGPIDAFGWHALAGGHMGIHRAQIERILQGLPGKQRGR